MAQGADQNALDEAALERLYVELERPMVNVVYRWVWDAHEAQDLVQEAFMRLWRMRARVDLDRVVPLVYRIALNLAANVRRRRRLWRWLALDAAPERITSGPASHDVLERRERDAALRRAVDALPERLRQVVMLSELGELSYREVAEVLGIPVGTVASRRHAALAKLRRHYLPDEAQEAGDGPDTPDT